MSFSDTLLFFEISKDQIRNKALIKAIFLVDITRVSYLFLGFSSMYPRFPPKKIAGPMAQWRARS